MQEIFEINYLIKNLQGIPIIHETKSNISKSSTNIENNGIIIGNSITEILRLNYELNRYNDEFVKNRKYKMLEFNFIFDTASKFLKNSVYCEKFELNSIKKKFIFNKF